MRNNSGCRGFTYLAALMIIMVMGIMLGIVGQSWKTIMQREREEELIFRGRQYKDAITHWYTPRTGEQVVTGLQDMKYLLQDPRMSTTVRYLRRLYSDPMTGKDFTIIKDTTLPGGGGISGVSSTSQDRPFKLNNFPDDLLDLNGKLKYSDWKFVYKQPLQSQQPQPSTTTIGTKK